jgi:hypothetical protein
VIFVGASGGYDTEITAPLPADENAEEPTELIAATYANTLDCKLSMNGDPKSTDIGI